MSVDTNPPRSNVEEIQAAIAQAEFLINQEVHRVLHMAKFSEFTVTAESAHVAKPGHRLPESLSIELKIKAVL